MTALTRLVTSANLPSVFTNADITRPELDQDTISFTIDPNPKMLKLDLGSESIDLILEEKSITTTNKQTSE
jgi:hypothetical protein